MIRSSVRLSVLALVLALSACASAPVAKARTTALVVGEAILGVDQIERQLYRGNVYDKATHDNLGAIILRALYAGRSYERAVAQLETGQSLPADVESAFKAVEVAIDDLQKAIPATAAARQPLMKGIAAIRAALAALSARQTLPVVRTAQAGGVMGIFALLQILAQLLASGRTTVDRVREFLRREGATDAELADLDARYTAAIAAREAEQAPE